MIIYDREIKFRVDEKTDMVLRKKAKEERISMSTYLRKLICSEKNISRSEYLDYKQLIYEINRIGNNINQVAKNHNSSIYKESDYKQLIECMDKIITLMEELHPGKLKDR